MTNHEYARILEINELYSQLDEIDDQFRAMGENASLFDEYWELCDERHDICLKLQEQGESYPDFVAKGQEFEDCDDSDQDAATEHNYTGSQSYAAYYDRDDLARENLRSGFWCEVQAAEFRVGA